MADSRSIASTSRLSPAWKLATVLTGLVDWTDWTVHALFAGRRGSSVSKSAVRSMTLALAHYDFDSGVLVFSCACDESETLRPVAKYRVK